MATIREKPVGSGRHEIRIYLGRDSSGVPKQISRTFKGSARAANKFASELERQLSGAGAATAAMSVREALDVWLTQHAEWAPLTLTAYERRAEAIKSDLRFANKKLLKLRVRDVEDWINALRRAGVGEPEIRNRFNALRAALSDATRRELIPRNPAASVELKSPKRPKRELMERAVVVAELAAAAELSEQIHLALRLTSITGSREAEIAALRWKDLDGDNLTFDSQIQVLKGVRVDRPIPKSDHGHRTVKIDAATVALWHAARAASVAERTYVFGDEGRREPPSPQRFLTWHRQALRAAGEDDAWRFHDLRHWSASTALGDGADLRSVADRLGNTPEIVLRTYAHTLPSRDAAIADSLASGLDAAEAS